jgi:hypothetical protein
MDIDKLSDDEAEEVIKELFRELPLEAQSELIEELGEMIE